MHLNERFGLDGKVALVTGGASGIGRASAVAMAEAGADVAVLDRDVDAGQETVAAIDALGRGGLFVQCDVTDEPGVAAAIGAVQDHFGRLDIAHNNAGGGRRGPRSAEDGAGELFRHQIELNLISVFSCCHAEAKIMIPQGGGCIVNTASMAGSVIMNVPYELMSLGAGLAGYSAAKAGVKHLTKALAVEWAEHDIRVNSISPGFTTTPATAFVLESPALLEQENSLTPMKRQGEVDELVGAILYLVSGASSFTTGHDLVIDGGHTVW
jgi:NAD(P)-dependent dehydrogenase (short-subunit alcohol dehydrogenase family)